MQKFRHTYREREYNRQTGVFDNRLVTLEMEIDWDKLAQALGSKARKNKSGKSRLACGVSVKVRDVKETTDA